MAYLYRKHRSPFWYVVYFDADKKEIHRSTGLRADDPNDTAKAKAMRAELEAKEHHRVPVVNTEGWDSWVPKYLERRKRPANPVLDGHGLILRKGGGHVHDKTTRSTQRTILAAYSAAMA